MLTDMETVAAVAALAAKAAAPCSRNLQCHATANLFAVTSTQGLGRPRHDIPFLGDFAAILITRVASLLLDSKTS